MITSWGQIAAASIVGILALVLALVLIAPLLDPYKKEDADHDQADPRND